MSHRSLKSPSRTDSPSSTMRSIEYQQPSMRIISTRTSGSCPRTIFSPGTKTSYNTNRSHVDCFHFKNEPSHGCCNEKAYICITSPTIMLVKVTCHRCGSVCVTWTIGFSTSIATRPYRPMTKIGFRTQANNKLFMGEYWQRYVWPSRISNWVRKWDLEKLL